MTRKQQYDRAKADMIERIKCLPANKIYELRDDFPIIFGKIQDFFQFYYPDNSGTHSTFNDFLNLLADDTIMVSYKILKFLLNFYLLIQLFLKNNS